MIILVINSGSSSIKFNLWDTRSDGVLCEGIVERIGHDDAMFSYKSSTKAAPIETMPVHSYTTGIKLILSKITNRTYGVLNSIGQINAVGHRVVHGGPHITKSELITSRIKRTIEEAIPLAPLHNPPNLAGINAIEKLLPDVPNVGVFDTAFHSTIPEEAYIYPIDYAYFRDYGIRRFGFHGTSHHYVALKGAELLGIEFSSFNCVTCHLGNGVSLTAVRNGMSVDTSLGYGTVCGAPMGTRSGDVDPAIILHLIDSLNMSTGEVRDLLYHHSGLFGLSGISNDVRDIQAAADRGDSRAVTTLHVFCHCIRKYIASMASNLEGRIDAIIFTAGIGENAPIVREFCCRGLEMMGVELDSQRNLLCKNGGIISTDRSAVQLLVVPTHEEHMIALETRKIVEKL